MYIIAIGWGFVVVLMAAAEAMQASVVGGVLTLLFYGVIPIGVFLYLAGTPARRRVREARARSAQPPPGA